VDRSVNNNIFGIQTNRVKKMLDLNKVYNMDVLEGLKQLEDESVDCVITSPPYWALRDYGEGVSTVWDGKEGCEHEWESNAEVVRFSKKKYTNSGVIEQEEDLHEFKTRGDSFCNVCNAWRGQLGLEPSFDLYLKHLLSIFDEVLRVLKVSGSVWVNMGDTYGGNTQAGDLVMGNPEFNKNRPSREETKLPAKNSGSVPSKCLVGVPERFMLGMIDRGWILRNKIVWHKPNCMPSSARDRFTVDFEPIYFFVKSKKYFFDMPREAHVEPNRGKGEKESIGKVKGGSSLDTGFANKIGGWADSWSGVRQYNPLGRAGRTVWRITTQPFSEAHFATFPEELVRKPLLAGCPEYVCVKCGVPKRKTNMVKKSEDAFNIRVRDVKEDRIKHSDRVASNEEVASYNEKEYRPTFEHVISQGCSCDIGFKAGVVLDPFMGSGTVGVVARKNSRDFIGFELSEEYCGIADKRLRPFLEQKKLTEVM